jgi:pimeloyl-ACP methyl ester carboxylesterase
VRPHVIFLPGGVVPASLAYGALMEALNDEAVTLAKDLELYASAQPAADYTLGHEVTGVCRAARDARWDRFHLVGFSAGGAASLAFAEALPERLLSLALIEPAWMGNVGLSPQERTVRREFERIAELPTHERMAAFITNQLAPGVDPPSRTEPAPSWMATRPAGLGALTKVFASSTLDLDRLRSFTRPVYFAVGGQSNPDNYQRMAQRASSIFPDCTVDLFAQRSHVDPPHQAEPVRLARALRAHWTRAEVSCGESRPERQPRPGLPDGTRDI